jgi:hypothetical protein
MFALSGAKNRTVKHWEGLLEKVDPKLEIAKMHYNPRGAGIVQVCLKSA